MGDVRGMRPISLNLPRPAPHPNSLPAYRQRGKSLHGYAPHAPVAASVASEIDRVSGGIEHGAVVTAAVGGDLLWGLALVQLQSPDVKVVALFRIGGAIGCERDAAAVAVPHRIEVVYIRRVG